MNSALKKVTVGAYGDSQEHRESSEVTACQSHSQGAGPKTGTGRKKPAESHQKRN